MLVRDYTCTKYLWWSPTRPVILEDSLIHTDTHTKFCLYTEGGSVCFMPVPEVVGGNRLTATVIDLSPWVEYEFRVLASNTIGTGEPSKPSKQARTKGTCMYRMSRKMFPYASCKTSYSCSFFKLNVMFEYLLFFLAPNF